MRLLSGAQTEIGDRMFRSNVYGDLFRPIIKPVNESPLIRFNRLAEKWGVKAHRNK